MTRTVDVELIQKAVDAREPMGREKLAIDLGVPMLTLMRIMRGLVPKALTRQSMAQALGVPVDTLFPPVRDESESA